ncbi:MAG: CPBP family intramembrane metalloprotease [Treponema sp.]|jgi:membrane protease YdiL (CAAX protease family)|nr:CPBP family intramembrane metalloprotease [Treponema sp.]
MVNIIEALVLYALLFFPRYAGTPASIPFSVGRELSRAFIYNTPAFLLVFYLLNGNRFRNKSENIVSLRHGLRSFLTFSIVLPVLSLISVCASAASGFFSPAAPSPALEKPSDAAGWLVLTVACLTTGLLEETFFRVYLPKRFSSAGAPLSFLLSTALFALSHLYEGPWGMANAFLAGLFLCVVFAKTKNLAGVAAAHGVYNLLVYAAS